MDKQLTTKKDNKRVVAMEMVVKKLSQIATPNFQKNKKKVKLKESK